MYAKQIILMVILATMPLNLFSAKIKKISLKEIGEENVVTIKSFFSIFKPKIANNNNNCDDQNTSIELDSELYEEIFFNLLTNQPLNRNRKTPLQIAAQVGHSYWFDFLTSKKKNFTFSFQRMTDNSIYTISINDQAKQNTITSHINSLKEFRKKIKSVVAGKEKVCDNTGIFIMSKMSDLQSETVIRSDERLLVEKFINQPIMEKGETPLIYAIKNNNMDAFNDIHRNGAKLDVPSFQNETPENLLSEEEYNTCVGKVIRTQRTLSRYKIQY
jgi:hypothetical protein